MYSNPGLSPVLGRGGFREEEEATARLQHPGSGRRRDPNVSAFRLRPVWGRGDAREEEGVTARLQHLGSGRRRTQMYPRSGVIGPVFVAATSGRRMPPRVSGHEGGELARNLWF